MNAEREGRWPRAIESPTTAGAPSLAASARPGAQFWVASAALADAWFSEMRPAARGYTAVSGEKLRPFSPFAGALHPWRAEEV